MNWNIAAECISTVILCIIWIYSRQSHSLPTLKNKLFQLCFLATFCAMTTNILSTICIQMITVVPLWINWIVTTVYFVATPLMGTAYFYYALSILCENRPFLLHRCLILCVPAILYLIMVLLNPVTGWLFTLSEIHGYVQGPYIFSTYIIFYIYCLSVFAAVLILGKQVEPVIRKILTAFPLIASLVVIIQQFAPHIILSGSAATCAILILYLYLQNKQISIDYLLSIPNHKEFMDVLIFHLKRKKEVPFCIIIISLRSFKQVNDSFGQHNGDEFLKKISIWLQAEVKPYQIYRYNGDEFAIILPSGEKQNHILVERLAARFTQPWHVPEFSSMINAAFGVVHYPHSADTMDNIINALEYTVSQAKLGMEGNICTCTPDMLEAVKRRYKIIDILKHALENHKFAVYYQPIWSAGEQSFTLAESLLRLPDSALGPLYPSEFIPIAEETGLIIEITYQVLDTVCGFIKELIAAGTNLESITVNLSGVQFSQHNLTEKFFSIIEKHGIPFHMIKIEITESMIAENKEILDEFIDSMHQKGIQIALDDFGTGYCNLMSILSMEVDVIKIDKSLLWSSMKDKRSAVMMHSITKAVQDLGMTVVSEGVETEEQEQFVHECGCKWIQGFLYAKPMPQNEAMKLLSGGG